LTGSAVLAGIRGKQTYQYQNQDKTYYGAVTVAEIRKGAGRPTVRAVNLIVK